MPASESHDFVKSFAFQPMQNHIHQLRLQLLHIFFHVNGDFVLNLKNLKTIKARQDQSSSNIENINKTSSNFQHLQSSSAGDCWKCMEMFDLLRPWPLSPQHFWQCPCRSQMLSWDPSCWWLDPLTSHQRPGKNTKRWCCWHQCPRRRSETQSSKESKFTKRTKSWQDCDTSWLWLRSMPHLDILDLHLHVFHFCIFLHIYIYISNYFYARLQQQQPCQESRSWGSHPLRWSRRPFGPWAAPRHLCRWIPAFATPVALLEGRHSWPAPSRQAARPPDLESWEANLVRKCTKRILSYSYRILIVYWFSRVWQIAVSETLVNVSSNMFAVDVNQTPWIAKGKGLDAQICLPKIGWHVFESSIHNKHATLSKTFKTNTDWWPTLPKTKLPWSDSDWSAFPGLVLVCANSPYRLGATRMGESMEKQKKQQQEELLLFFNSSKTDLNMFTLVTLVTRVALACQGAFLEKQS